MLTPPKDHTYANEKLAELTIAHQEVRRLKLGDMSIPARKYLMNRLADAGWRCEDHPAIWHEAEYTSVSRYLK